MNHESLTNPKIEVAIAILEREDKFLMQLRDDIPGIMNPGCWGLFGGHLEAGEAPEVAMVRELQEEIEYHAPNPLLFGCYNDERVIRYVFFAPLIVDICELKLNEGWDFKLVTPAEIDRGYCYSHEAQAAKPLGKIHRQILLDCIATKVNKACN
jgi:8-oxo-dGTP pyrophosphatase MutT (NUDIX family)